MKQGKKEIVVIIGGPGTGKTTIIDTLKSMGHCCYPEISREVTLEAKKQGIEQIELKEKTFEEFKYNAAPNDTDEILQMRTVHYENRRRKKIGE